MRTNIARMNCGWVLVALLSLLPSVSLAHGMLIRAQPAADSEIAQLPETVRLSFSERVESRFSRVTVHRARRDAETGEITARERIDEGMADGPAVTQELAVHLPETLAAGLYLIQWQVLSVDSHRTTGRFTITYKP
jgi:methionine-rich copper-binding protein CopC